MWELQSSQKHLADEYFQLSTSQFQGGHFQQTNAVIPSVSTPANMCLTNMSHAQLVPPSLYQPIAQMHCPGQQVTPYDLQNYALSNNTIQNTPDVFRNAQQKAAISPSSVKPRETLHQTIPSGDTFRTISEVSSKHKEQQLFL